MKDSVPGFFAACVLRNTYKNEGSRDRYSDNNLDFENVSSLGNPIAVLGNFGCIQAKPFSI